MNEYDLMHSVMSLYTQVYTSIKDIGSRELFCTGLYITLYRSLAAYLLFSFVFNRVCNYDDIILRM